MGRGRLLAPTTLFALLAGCAATPEPADLVLRGGTIVTMDPARPRAQALAARAGRIVAIGDDEAVAAFVGPTTRVVPLGDLVAVPGLIEGHGHLLGLGRARASLDLTSARDWDEVVARVAKAAASKPAGAWILGWGWHQEKWDRPPSPAVEGYPVHDALSRAAPHHPVLLKHAAGAHMGIVNSAAMALAGIDAATPDPPGGTILRDPEGRPTGVLRENAYQLALTAYDRSRASRSPQERETETRHELAVASEECLRKGITSFQDAHSSLEEIDLFRRVAEDGKLPIRLYVMVLEPNDVLRARLGRYRWIGLADDHLTVRAVKKQMDGALGAHGAWLLAPYADLPAGSGLNTTTPAEIEEAARIALDHGFQLAVHAIGDRANRETLDVYARALAQRKSPEGPRFRVEHAQLLAPEDVPRFAALGVIASMQGIHCTSDGPWVEERIGPERAEERAYVWRRLLDAGATVCNGTDTPIEDVDPIANFHSSVTRVMNDGRAFYPAQAMSREEALRSMTRDAAYAAFEEGIKGTLAPGKLADVTVLTKDLLTCSREELRDVRVAFTIVGGRVLYEER